VRVTYLNDKARPSVDPLAKELEVPIFLACDMLHTIAFAPKETCTAG
jgi:hypothetical protein